jgi:putative spermidine/putrescine transport system permease protein
LSSLTTSEAGQAASARRKKRLTAFLFVVPLLLFILVTFVAPIGTMLWRSVHHPTVAELIPLTLAELQRWDDHKQLPDEKTLQVFVTELHGLNEQRLSGKLSEEFNRAYTGMSSVVKSSARRIGRLDAQKLETQGVKTLLDAHRNWSKPELWYAIERAGKVYTYDYYPDCPGPRTAP